MIIDMHVHTNVSSPCSMIDPGRLVRGAAGTGLDAICVTEHDEIEGALLASDLGRKHGFPVFRGIEIYTDLGDMLVYGYYGDAPGLVTPFEELLAICDQAGAVIVPAHPCRFFGELEKLYGEGRADSMLRRVTAVETHNGGSSPEGNEAALRLARGYGLPGTGGSDAHHEFQVGRCVTVFRDRITTDAELVAALRSGRYHGAYRRELDPVRDA